MNKLVNDLLKLDNIDVREEENKIIITAWAFIGNGPASVEQDIIEVNDYDGTVKVLVNELDLLGSDMFVLRALISALEVIKNQEW